MVRKDSPLRGADEVDRDGVRVATGAGSAYDLFLERTLKHARIERRATAAQAFELLVDGSLDVAAGVRHVVDRYAQQHRGLRVLQPCFMVIEQAMGTPAGREAGALYLADFVNEMKASGFIADSLARSGHGDVVLAR